MLDIDKLLLANMRQIRPPVPFSDPEHVLLPQRDVAQRPFEGQPRKYASPRRLPEHAVKISSVTVLGTGYGLFRKFFP
jgi:hypothetical protein